MPGETYGRRRSAAPHRPQGRQQQAQAAVDRPRQPVQATAKLLLAVGRASLLKRPLTGISTWTTPADGRQRQRQLPQREVGMAQRQCRSRLHPRHPLGGERDHGERGAAQRHPVGAFGDQHPVVRRAPALRLAGPAEAGEQWGRERLPDRVCRRRQHRRRRLPAGVAGCCRRQDHQPL